MYVHISIMLMPCRSRMKAQHGCKGNGGPFQSSEHVIMILLFNSTLCSSTPGLRLKIPVFSDPAPGKSLATTYEQINF